MRSKCEIIRYLMPGRAAVAVVTLLAFLTACTDAKPTNYPMHAAIPFGNVQISVNSVESTSEVGRQSILVHVRVEGLDGESQARVASQSWDQWFRLSDSDGKKYRCRRFLPTDYYYQNFHYGGRGGEQRWSTQPADDIFATVPSSWIMHFDVPPEAHGFTLLMNNMTFHTAGQPVSIAVTLDR